MSHPAHCESMTTSEPQERKPKEMGKKGEGEWDSQHPKEGEKGMEAQENKEKTGAPKEGAGGAQWSAEKSEKGEKGEMGSERSGSGENRMASEGGTSGGTGRDMNYRGSVSRDLHGEPEHKGEEGSKRNEEFSGGKTGTGVGGGPEGRPKMRREENR